ncbi:MAG: hypothetical protein LUD72_11655 [Bacteroidales bacterium]|nr:hypothetical protein [Bacteroidales bacterium]
MRRAVSLKLSEGRLFDSKRLYRPIEAARMWGCSRGTIYNKMRAFPWVVVDNRVAMRRLLSGAMLNKLYYGEAF